MEFKPEKSVKLQRRPLTDTYLYGTVLSCTDVSQKYYNCTVQVQLYLLAAKDRPPKNQKCSLLANFRCVKVFLNGRS